MKQEFWALLAWGLQNWFYEYRVLDPITISYPFLGKAGFWQN